MGQCEWPTPKMAGTGEAVLSADQGVCGVSSVGYGTEGLPLSHTEGESKECPASLGPRRLSEAQGRPLKEGNMVGKGEEQVAGVKAIQAEERLC